MLRCGAENKSDDGEKVSETFPVFDACCKKHIACPLSIITNMQHWGVRNNVGYTISGCNCDDELYGCLKVVSKYL